MTEVNPQTIFDLLDLINDDRRHHEAVALTSPDADRRKRSTTVFRRQTAATSTVRRGIADLMRGNATDTERARRINEYTRLLVDEYLDGADGITAL